MTKQEQKAAFYDGTKLLSLTDINREKPELYMCTTNRSAGKTTYFGRLLVNNFLKNGKKFCLIYRFDYELKDVSDKFFKDIGSLFFPYFIMTSKCMSKGIYYELFIQSPGWEEPKSCGYAIALNKADQVKRLSHLFSDTQAMLFDEFQSETNHYCPNEVQKFISVHTSIARGQGKQVRYLPVYMLSNAVTLLNPYYAALGVSKRLTPNTKFLRGEGWVLEQGYNDTAAEAQKTSAFNRAFNNEKYVDYAATNSYLNDNSAFIDKVSGQSKYLCTLKYDGKQYAIREYPETGVIYCDDRPDTTFPYKITVTSEDHDINYVMLKRNDLFLAQLRWYFEKGCFRFRDLKCKEVILSALSYL